MAGHVKPWQRIARRYTPEQQLQNRQTFLAALPKLPLAKLVDYGRRDRGDPRLVDEGTPLCIADWSWRMFGAGTVGALGLHQGALSRLVKLNDAGIPNEEMKAFVVEELLNKPPKARRAVPRLRRQ